MGLFSLLQKKSRLFLPFLALLGLINSIWASALLLLINNKITGKPLPFFDEYDWIIYSGIIVASYLFARFFQGYMIRLTYNLGNELGLSIFDKLRFTTYQEYQKLGEERVRTAMQDVSTLQRFPQAFIETFNSGVMVLIGIIYLFFINAISASIITAVLVVLAAVYYLRNMAIAKDLSAVRDLANTYQQNVNDFLRGFKEVKMNIDRSDKIYNDYLATNRNKTVKLTVRALTRHMSNELLGSYAWYFMIGFIFFLLPVLIQLEGDVMINFVVTLLYLMGPTNMLVGELEIFTRLGIAMDRLKKFNKTISASKSIEIRHGDTTDINPYFDSIRFEDVVFEYYDEKKAKTFRLGPLNLEITRGEVVFIMGGNGSGKSTFINLFTGLFLPKSGSIYLNGNKISMENYPYYRNQLAAIFTDNYLFTENYDGFDLNPSNERLTKLVEKMGLTDILDLEEGKNKIKTTLSKGQQKRLALIYSILENKDIFIFDEWAAEQDPVFRRYFYQVIIPELKANGKTVIAVTHDDAYFDCAERLIKFDYGQIISDRKERVLSLPTNGQLVAYEI